MPLVKFPRRMTVVRLATGKLVIYSAIALDDAGMRALEAFGEPGYLVVPNDIHRLDARIYKERYPGLVVLAPASAARRRPHPDGLTGGCGWAVALDKADESRGGCAATAY